MAVTIDGSSGLTTNDGSVFTDASGNVGIGTSSPASRLHVDGNAVFGQIIQMQGESRGSVRIGSPDASGGITERPVSYGNNLLLIKDPSDEASSIWSQPTTNVGGTALVMTADNGGYGTFQFFAAQDQDVGASIVERARIDEDGNLLVGTASGSGNIAYIQSVVASADKGAWVSESGATASRIHMRFRNPNGQVGSISTSASATAYTTSSDYRLKHDIQPMSGALAKVATLKPVTYKWNADDSAGEGFIAHELAEAVPGCVIGEKDAVDAEGNPVYQGIDTSFLVATLTAAIQEQQAIITALTARVEALEGAQA
jgi:hypothetical protein